jgi:hypothetical protein
MSDHDEWLATAETAVRDEFPSLTDIDAARIVELAVDIYEREKWVTVSQRINTLWHGIREENNKKETWFDDNDTV